MLSRRIQSGNTPTPTKPGASPSSVGSFSKSKRSGGRHLAKRNQTLQYLLAILVTSIALAYIVAITRLSDSGGAEQPRTNGGGGGGDGAVKVTTYNYETGQTGRTPEGQQLLLDQQTHVRKDLSVLVPELKYLKEQYPAVDRSSDTKLFKPYSKKNRVQVDKKRDKAGNVVYAPLTAVKKDDLIDMGYDKKEIDALGNITYDDAIKGKERLVDILYEAGIEEIDPEAIAVLPKWESVTKLYGEKPVILGLERCAEFRNQADPIDASLGTAGMFNTGTNPMAMYVSNNCLMPNNRKDKAGGTRWQVPWGKHRFATEKYSNTPPHEKKTNKTNVLPIVLVRDPFTWMQSMCKNKYEGRWVHDLVNCPNLAKPKLKADGTPDKVPMSVKYNPPRDFGSLADYWADWYKEYLEVDYPRLIVRFEDIHFHARELIETICQCAGAVPREDDGMFRYVTESAKWGKAHTSKSNIVSTMVKYGSDKKRFKGFKETDWLVAKEVFTPEIMELFGYEYPEKMREMA